MFDMFRISRVYMLVTVTALCLQSAAAAKGFNKPVAAAAFKYTGTTVPGKLSPPLAVPPEIERPEYALYSDGRPRKAPRLQPWDITPQTAEDIARMRVAGRIAREVLDTAVRAALPGTTTAEIDRIVHTASKDCLQYIATWTVSCTTDSSHPLPLPL